MTHNQFMRLIKPPRPVTTRLSVFISCLAWFVLGFAAIGRAEVQKAELTVSFTERLGPLDIDKMALGSVHK